MPSASNKPDHRIETAIREVYQQICLAFEQADMELALSYFSDREDMVKISNGRFLRGKAQLANYWRQRIGGGAAPRISISNIGIHRIDEHHVWATADEQIVLGGQTQQAIVSNIFVRTDTGWKILLDHTTYIST